MHRLHRFSITLLILCVGACGGDDTTPPVDAQGDASGAATDSASSTGGDDKAWCFSPADCEGAGEICTIEMGDCQSCDPPNEVCCGVCAPDPCSDKACGDDCTCPEGMLCAEFPRNCNAEGQCVAANEDPGCGAPVPYDPCKDLACGDPCLPCHESDSECLAQPSAAHLCDAQGECVLDEGEAPVCASETCGMGTGSCAEGEVCTLSYGDCVACGNGSESEPVCCGVCSPDPCAGKACGADCTCPEGIECAELPMGCNSEGICLTINQELGCEEPEPYDACAELACGADCQPCAPEDTECAMRPSLPHFCDPEGQCVDDVPVCESSTCMLNEECGAGEICTTAYQACVPCEGSESESECCGTCEPDPCADKVCSDLCTCPEGVDCPDVLMVCDIAGHCSTEAECIGPICEGKECGTPCGPAHVCDLNGECLITNTPVTELCGVEAGDCTSSAECEVGQACTVLDEVCLPCADAPMLAVCCGLCEPYDPCKDKLCGEGCGLCPPDQPECPEPATQAEWYCSAEGQCDDSVPSCN